MQWGEARSWNKRVQVASLPKTPPEAFLLMDVAPDHSPPPPLLLPPPLPLLRPSKKCPKLSKTTQLNTQSRAKTFFG